MPGEKLDIFAFYSPTSEHAPGNQVCQEARGIVRNSLKNRVLHSTESNIPAATEAMLFCKLRPTEALKHA